MVLPRYITAKSEDSMTSYGAFYSWTLRPVTLTFDHLTTKYNHNWDALSFYVNLFSSYKPQQHTQTGSDKLTLWLSPLIFCFTMYSANGAPRAPYVCIKFEVSLSFHLQVVLHFPSEYYTAWWPWYLTSDLKSVQLVSHDICHLLIIFHTQEHFVPDLGTDENRDR